MLSKQETHYRGIVCSPDCSREARGEAATWLWQNSLRWRLSTAELITVAEDPRATSGDRRLAMEALILSHVPGDEVMRRRLWRAEAQIRETDARPAQEAGE